MRLMINMLVLVLFCSAGFPGVAAAQSSGGTEGTGATGIKPLGTGEPIDYYNSQRMREKSISSNLIQEQTPLPSGECVQRVVPPLSTTAVPFIYDGKPQSINMAPGQNVTRLFVSTVPGYDPLNKMAQGPHADFVSPCHAQANLPQVCKDGICTPDPDNQNTLMLIDAAAPMPTPPACVLITNEIYYMNIQNQTQIPLCASLGMGAECAPCQ